MRPAPTSDVRQIMANLAPRSKHWVTERVRDALATGSNVELLKALVEAFPGSWFFTRVDGTFAYVNRTACDSLGYTREELMALTLFDVNPTLTRESWNALLDMGPFTPTSVLTQHRRKDGVTIPVEAFGSRIILGDENVAVSYVIDVSEEAEARRALADRQHLLQTLLDSAPVAVWLVGADGRIEVSEGSGASLFGNSAGPVIGKTAVEAFRELPALVQATARALEGNSVEGMIAVGEREYEYQYQPRRDMAGSVLGATGVAIDVTDRRGFERTNQRLVTAIEQAEESIVLLGRGGLIEFASASFAAASGVPKSALYGRRWIELLPDTDAAPASRDAIARALDSGTAWNGTIQWPSAQNRERIEQTSLSPISDAADRLTGFVVVSRDITEQVRAEQRLRQVEKMEAVGQLAGGVAHDFNNLLQVILGNAELGLARHSPEPQDDLLRGIRDAGLRAASLVSQLLTFSRNVGEPKIVGIADLVERILPLLRRLLGSHILIEFGASDGGLEVWGEASQLEQIVLNLCVNARDAMPEGGRLAIELSLSAIEAEEAARLGLAGPARYVVLEVSDTGCGMSAEVERRVFEPFFTTKAPGTGTGLGLATVYAIAKRNGGAVEVHSQLGKGTRFRVLLRHAECQRAPSAPISVPGQGAASGLRVLLVENDDAVREVTRCQLVQSGHHVVAVARGAEALELLRTEIVPFDLLVVDAIMPHVSGPEVYRAFRSTSGAPVLFVSGHEFNTLDALPSDPARSLLRKPYSALEIAAAIRALFEAQGSVPHQGSPPSSPEPSGAR